MEALDRQEPFINQTLAVSSLAMLARLLRYGQISYHGGFYNAETGRMAALPVDPDPVCQDAEGCEEAALQKRCASQMRGRVVWSLPKMLKGGHTGTHGAALCHGSDSLIRGLMKLEAGKSEFEPQKI